MTRRNSRKVSRFGQARQFGRALVIEGVGIVLIAFFVGIPLLSNFKQDFSCLESKPSTIDAEFCKLLGHLGMLRKGQSSSS